MWIYVRSRLNILLESWWQIRIFASVPCDRVTRQGRIGQWLVASAMYGNAGPVRREPEAAPVLPSRVPLLWEGHTSVGCPGLDPAVKAAQESRGCFLEAREAARAPDTSCCRLPPRCLGCGLPPHSNYTDSLYTHRDSCTGSEVTGKQFLCFYLFLCTSWHPCNGSHLTGKCLQDIEE